VRWGYSHIISDRDGVAVFGLDAVPTLFAECLGFLLIAASTSKLSRQTTRWVCGALLIPTAIYAACMIRLTFIATFAAILLAAVLSDRRCRVLAIALLRIRSKSSGSAIIALLSYKRTHFPCCGGPVSAASRASRAALSLSRLGVPERVHFTEF
jgi:hypothetical protein